MSEHQDTAVDGILVEHIEEQIRSTERSTRFGIAFIVLLCLGITGYFHWMKGQVAEILEPSALAEFAVSEVGRTIPAARGAIEQHLDEAAPQMVELAMQTVVEEAIPALRTEAERLLALQATDLINVTAKASSDIFEEVVKAKASELRAKKDAGPGIYTSEAFVADLDSAVKAGLGHGLDARVKNKEDALAASAQALRNVNAHLEQMAEADSSERKDRLTRRFVTAWWSFLQTSDVGNGETYTVIADEAAGG